MIKIILGLFIVCLCTFIGYLLSNKYIYKKEFYLGFNEFNRVYINNVKFIKKPLKDLINGVAENKFTLLLKENLFNNNSEIENNYLTDSDKSLFENYIKILGKSDSESQLEYVNSLEEILKNNLNISIENERKYKTLYLKLGFLTGLLVFILIL